MQQRLEGGCGRSRARICHLAASLLILLLTSCSAMQPTLPSGAPQPQGGTEGIAIRFAVYDGEETAYGDLIDAFEEGTPGLHVQLVSIDELLDLDPGTGLGSLDGAQRLVAAADVLSLDPSHRLVNQGLLRDLTPFLEGDPGFDPADFYPNILESCQWAGGTWALPLAATFRLVYYDRDAFDESGVPYPEPGWTWDEFVDRARALTIREGDGERRWGFVPPRPDHRPFLEGRVGPLVDWDTDPPTARLDQPQIVEAVQWYADLYLEERAIPYFPQPEGVEGLRVLPGQALIDGGQAAMWTDGSYAWLQYSQRRNVGVVPFPVEASGLLLVPASPGGGTATTPMAVQSLSMSASTAQPEAAWRWLLFLSRQPAADLGFGIPPLPARRSVAESSGFWEALHPELAEALRYAVEHSLAPERETAGSIILSRAIDAILSGAEPVEDTLAEAQAQVDAEIREGWAPQAGANPMPTFVVRPPEQEVDEQRAVTITFVPGTSLFDAQRYRDLAASFHETQSSITVWIEVRDWRSSFQEVARRADCLRWTAAPAHNPDPEAILSLQPFLDADPAFPLTDFYPQLLERLSWQGQLWGLPADADCYVVEYNKDLFDAAGLAYPSLAWSTDDLLTLAVALTRGEGEEKQYGFVGDWNEVDDLLAVVERLGGRLMDRRSDPPAFTFDDPVTVEAVRWYAALVTEYGVKPVLAADAVGFTDGSVAFPKREALIGSGRAAMWTAHTRQFPLSDRDGLRIGAAPFPGGPAGMTGVAYFDGDAYFISARSQVPQACWQWITFLTGQLDAAPGLPPRRSVAESDAYRQRVGAERAAAYRATLNGTSQAFASVGFPQEEWSGMALYWFARAYVEVLTGQEDVEEALHRAQDLADDYRACVTAHDAFDDNGSLLTCVQRVDPSVPADAFGLEGE
jgi:multiple sugar transport system substrate-binding protein